MNLHDAAELLVSKGLFRETTNPNNGEKYYSRNPKLPKSLNWNEELEKLFNENSEFASLYKSYPTDRDFMYCVNHNMYPEDIPRCPICGDYAKITPKWTVFYRDTCGKMECQNEIKARKAFIKYGVRNVSQAPEVKRKKSETTLEHYGVPWPSLSEEVKEKQANTMREKYGEDYAKVIAEKTKKSIKEKYGVDNISQAEGIQSKKSASHKFLGINFRSSWELAFYIYNIDHNIDIIYEPEGLSYKTKDGKTRKYFPDFKIGDSYIEIKGNHLIDEDNNLDNNIYADYEDNKNREVYIAKKECMEKFNVKILKDEEIKPYLDYITLTYGGNYLSSFKSHKNVNVNQKTNKIKNLLESRRISYEMGINICSNVYDFVIYLNNKPHILIGTYPNKNFNFIDINAQFNFIENIILDLVGTPKEELIKSTIEKCKIFPIFSYDIKKEYNNLIERDFVGKPTKNINSSDIGLNIIRQYYPSIYKCSVDNKPSPYEAWFDEKLLRKCIENRIIYSKSLEPNAILNGFNVSKIAPKISVFNPLLAKYIINMFLGKLDVIFDPFSGFGGRLLGTCSLGKKYIGQDINLETVSESNSLIRDLNLNAEVIRKDIFESEGTYDYLFTCPPYGNKENWGNENQINYSCDQWIDECLKRFECKSYIFVVDNTEKYKGKVIYEINNRSHFGSNKELVIKIT